MIGVDPLAQENENIRVKRELNFGLVYIGLVIMVFGSMYYLNSSTDFDWSRFQILISFADLWSLILLYAGLSILRLKGWIGNTIGVCIVLICVAITGVSILNFDGEFRETITEPFTIENANNYAISEINLAQTAGKVTIQGGITGPNFMNGFFESNFSSVSLLSDLNPTEQIISAEISETSFWEGIGNYFKNLTILLNTELTHNINFTGDATRATFDLTDLKMNTFESSLRASDVLITLGANQPQANVDLETVASSVTMIIPSDVGLKVTTNENISFVNLPEELIQNSATEYQTELYELKSQKINLNLDSQFSRISIVQNPL
jgi:translation elongation factor EF-1beta